MLLWLGGVGALVKREYFRPSTQLLEEAAARVGPGASYYTLTMGGAPIGYATSIIDTIALGINVQNNTVMDIQTLGSVQKVGITTAMVLSRTLHLKSFNAQVNSDASRYRAVGQVEGDTVLNVTIDAGSTRYQRIPLVRPIVLPDLVNLRLAVGGALKPGRTYTLRMFDPMLMQERDVTLQVLAESTMVYADSARYDSSASRWVSAHETSTKAFKISEGYGGVSMESWVDERGDIISATSPIGFTMQRTAFEIAVENWKHDRVRGTTAVAGRGGDVIGATAIAANVELRPERLTRLAVRIGNVSVHGFDLSGGRQRLSGDTLTVTREHGFGSAILRGDKPALFDARLPFTTMVRDTAITNAILSEPLVQSDDSAIVRQARSIVGAERRAGLVAELLTTWVYRTLRKEITISVPSAVQVLQTKSGDCNEHTVLYVALARSLGLPSRTAAGVVYLRGHFYYHAWPEVWLGEWVAVDPTFGQFPADAAHLRFVIGGLARQVELVRLIGRLQLTVLSAE